MGDIAEFGIKVIIAALAGLIIGLEREIRGKDAGLKTNGLVSVGACVFVLISLQFHGEESVDITRVLGQVITGIGFIGAGAILQRDKRVEGITTAATIWCSAAAGALAAFDYYEELAALALIVLAINYGFGYLEKKLFKRRKKEKNNTRFFFTG